jgi:D-alanine-D-alanine ligase-like ATP-grasp enzyme
MRLEFSVYGGPSLLLPCPAVAMLVRGATSTALPINELNARLRAALPPELAAQVIASLADSNFETLAAAIAAAVQDGATTEHMPIRIERVDGLGGRITLGCYLPEATAAALRFGAEAAHWLLATAESDLPKQLPELHNRLKWVAAQQPDDYARLLLHAAQRRGIPSTCIAPGSRIWNYGQGRHGVQFFEGSNSRDSSIGVRITTNKLMGNALVTSLGFPGVQHGAAANPESARQIARALGYPVVVKPPDAGGGRGVTAWITDDAALATAFAKATAGGRPVALVEKHVAGDDHRLVVVGGRFVWAVRRTPAQVIADGMHSIAELVELENGRRSQKQGGDPLIKPIVLDEDAVSVLVRHGLTPDSRPAIGARVPLADVANLARGGTRTRVSNVHPDNRAMAEAVSRAFHLDTAGLDFMTPDITRSWRDVPCAILEVNATPGFGSSDRADAIVAAQFPEGSDGRVPSVLMVGASAAALAALAARITDTGLAVGVTDGDNTSLGDLPRFRERMPLAVRARALVLDPECEALVIGATAQEIEHQGLPLDRCHVAIIVGELPAPLQALLEDRAATLVHATDESAAALAWEALHPSLQ